MYLKYINVNILSRKLFNKLLDGLIKKRPVQYTSIPMSQYLQ